MAPIRFMLDRDEQRYTIHVDEDTQYGLYDYSISSKRTMVATTRELLQLAIVILFELDVEE